MAGFSKGFDSGKVRIHRGRTCRGVGCVAALVDLRDQHSCGALAARVDPHVTLGRYSSRSLGARRRPACFAVVLGVVGMLWADVTLLERWKGLNSFFKLLVIPLLFAQFRRSGNSEWVFVGYLVSCVALLVATAMSW